MKKNGHQILALLLSGALLTGSFLPAAAAGAAPEPVKDENVYAGLKQDGSVDSVYVVNSYLLEEETQITDYGKYDAVKNLTSGDEITVKEGRVTVNAPAGMFYYQGSLRQAELPWEISIRYYLDGEEVQAQELAGKNGSLKIVIGVAQNEKADETFFENYQLQAVVTMDMNRCSNLKAAGASEENTGSSKQLSYLVLAGQEREFTITADVLDFEMEAIRFRGLPMSLDVDGDVLSLEELQSKADEIDGDAQEFADGAGDLSGSLDALKEGTDGFKQGADALNEGLASFADGAGTLTDGIGTLQEGSGDVADGAVELKDGIYSIKEGIDQINGAYGGENGAVAGARKLAEGADKLQTASSQLGEGVSALIQMIRSMGDTKEMDEEVLAGLETIVQGLNSATAGMGLPAYQLQGSTAREKAKNLGDYLDNLILSCVAAAGGSSGSGGQNRLPEEDAAVQSQLISEETESGEESTSETEMEGTPASREESETGSEPESGTSAPEESSAPEEGSQPEGNSQPEGSVSEESSSQPEGNSQPEGSVSEESSSQPEGNSQPESSVSEESSTQDEGGLQSRGRSRSTGSFQKVSYMAHAGIERISLEQNPQDTFVIALSETGESKAGESTPSQAAVMVQQLLKIKSEVDKIIGGYQTMDSISQKLNSDTTQKQLSQLEEGAKALGGGVSELAGGAGELADGISKIAEGTGQLAGGAAELADGGDEFADGVAELADGMTELADGATVLTDATNDLKDGTGQIAEGAGELTDGVGELIDGTGELSDSTDEFREKTSKLSEQAGSEAERIRKSLSGEDYTPVSFVSDKNTRINLVQFTMKTEAICVTEQQTETVSEEKLGFWQRLLRLFGLG